MPRTPLPGPQKTALTAIETAITNAQALMNDPTDQYQVDAHSILEAMRRDLEQLRSLRGQ